MKRKEYEKPAMQVYELRKPQLLVDSVEATMPGTFTEQDI